MTTIEFLEKIYNHSFDMVKFSEAKNTTLIAFNGALIVGMIKVASDTQLPILFYYAIFVAVMASISIFICLSALTAKIKHSSNDISLPKSNNMLFFATIAHMNSKELLEKIKTQYDCIASNGNHENDLAMQAIITSQIASRKFKLFNVAIGFTFSGIATPVSIIIYKAFLDHDR